MININKYINYVKKFKFFLLVSKIIRNFAPKYIKLIENEKL